MTDKRVYDLLTEDDARSRQKKDERKNEVVLSSGIVLRLKRVPPMILAELERKFPTPPIPEVWDEEHGRNLRNPADPFYAETVKRNDENKGLALGDVMLGMGTEVIFVPDTICPPDRDDWIDDLAGFVDDIPRKGRARYLAWLKYVAIESADDIVAITGKIQGLAGVREEDVAAAIDSFPSNPE